MLLLIAVFLPIIAGVVVMLSEIAGGSRGKAAAAAGITVTVLSTLLVLVAATNPLVSGLNVYKEEYSWGPLGTAGFSLDGLATPFAITIAVLSSVVSVYSVRYMEHRFKELGRGPWGIYYGLLVF